MVFKAEMLNSSKTLSLLGPPCPFERVEQVGGVSKKQMFGVPHLLLASSSINYLLTLVDIFAFLGNVVQVNVANIKYHQNIFGQHQRMTDLFTSGPNKKHIQQ